MLNEMFYGNRAKSLPLGFDRPSVPTIPVRDRTFRPTPSATWDYTGVSFWMDLEKDVCIILLTNRVHPCPLERPAASISSGDP
jgi:hypothetical protein